MIICAVSRKRRQWAFHPLQQGTDLGGIIDVFFGQRGSDDFAGVGINADMQLPSGPTLLAAMLLDQPLAGTA